MALTLTVLYYVSLLAYYPILAILMVVPYCLGVSLVGLLIVVLVREDLVSDVIARYSEKPAAPKPKARRDRSRVASSMWTSEATSIVNLPLPPTLWFQLFINHVRKYEVAELAPVNKRLAAVVKRLAELDGKMRLARADIDFERMYLTAWSKKFHETRSIATNTDISKIVSRKSLTSEQDATTDTPPSVGDLSMFVNMLTRVKSTIKSVLGIVMTLTSIILWVVKLVISFENLKRLLKINYFLQSQRAKNMAKTVFDKFNKLFTVNMLINTEAGTTNYALVLFPKPGQTYNNFL